MMTPAEEERSERQKLSESMIRLEAKIDVVLSQHESKIDDLTRRQGETSSTLREHDSRITANALTIAETRSQAASAQSDVKLLRNDVARDVTEAKTALERQVTEAKQLVEAKSKNVPTWVMIGVACAALVLGPILTALIQR